LRRAAIGDRHFDQERVAAIDARWARLGGVELGRHDVVHSLEQLLHADGNQAIGRRRGNLRGLQGLVQRFGVVPPDTTGLARVLSLAASQTRAAVPGLTREKLDVRNFESVVPCVPCNNVTRLPSSMP